MIMEKQFFKLEIAETETGAIVNVDASCNGSFIVDHLAHTMTKEPWLMKEFIAAITLSVMRSKCETCNERAECDTINEQCEHTADLMKQMIEKP